MKWSWTLGTFAGIPVNVHATFLLLLIWIATSHWMQSRSLVAVLVGVAFTGAIFVCVTVHEYGHALMARRFGIRTKDITLLPIGGLARLERMPEKPREELWIALAGPAVNVLIAAVLGGFLLLAGHLEPMARASNRRCCSSLPTSIQYLMRMIPTSTKYFSMAGSVPKTCDIVPEYKNP